MGRLGEDRLKLLPTSLLGQQRRQVECFHSRAHDLHISLGWHYLLDLAWIARELGTGVPARVLDAGAGVGLLQWHLAELGATVLSVDRQDRSALAPHLRLQCRVSGLRPRDLSGAAKACAVVVRRPWRLLYLVDALLHGRVRARGGGEVILCHEDLSDLADIPTSSVDLVVSVSALEHNSLEGLPVVISELMRVLRPGGRLLATVSAARDSDWYDAHSRGWCLTEVSLRRLFQLPEDAPSNFADYDGLFGELCSSTELRRGLSFRYRLSGRNGMPWGRWAPRYHPVAVCRTKPLPPAEPTA